jgi:hypothetical protein
MLNLHESHYEGPSQKKAYVVGDYRACCFYAPVFWNYALNLRKTDSIATTLNLSTESFPFI